MAVIGINYPCFQQHGSARGVVIGKMVSATTTPIYMTAELAADDNVTEREEQLTHVELSIELDDIDNATQKILFGARTTGSGGVIFRRGDDAAEGVFAFYKRGIFENNVYFIGTMYKAVTARRAPQNSQTRGLNTNMQTSALTLVADASDEGYNLSSPRFTRELDAKYWVAQNCGVPIDVNGAAIVIEMIAVTALPVSFRYAGQGYAGKGVI